MALLAHVVSVIETLTINIMTASRFTLQSNTMPAYSCSADFAAMLLSSTNAVQRSLEKTSNYGRNWHNVDVAQAGQTYAAMHYRKHQPEY